jgi:hypothetical protein
VSGLALGGVAVGGGAAGALVARSTGSAGFHKKSLTVEVACLGNMWREGVKSNPADEGDFRAPFLVEGWIYPEGTIKVDGFIPTEEGSIGRWFCRGYIVIDNQRAEPHGSTHQDFIFGTITRANVFPRDTMSVTGLEGTSARDQVALRAVIGGTGAYLGAIGQVGERLIAKNSTVFAPDNIEHAPCFRFDFDIRVLD